MGLRRGCPLFSPSWGFLMEEELSGPFVMGPVLLDLGRARKHGVRAPCS